MYECVICKVKFQVSNEFEAHFKYFHGKIIDAKNAQSTHSEFHNCEVCNKTFMFKKSLQKHCETFHSDSDKRFKCDFCENRFTQKAHLQKHLRNIHQDITNGPSNSVKCEFCDVIILIIINECPSVSCDNFSRKPHHRF